MEAEDEKREKRKAELKARKEARLSGGLVPALDTQVDEE